jgi:hypothetical protein
MYPASSTRNNSNASVPPTPDARVQELLRQTKRCRESRGYWAFDRSTSNASHQTLKDNEIDAGIDGVFFAGGAEGKK